MRKRGRFVGPLFRITKVTSATNMNLYAQWAVSSYSLYKIIESTGNITSSGTAIVQCAGTYEYSVTERINIPCGDAVIWSLTSDTRSSVLINNWIYASDNTNTTYTYSGTVELQAGETISFDVNGLSYGYHSAYIYLTLQ